MRLLVHVCACLAFYACGWIGRLPTWKVANKLWTVVKRAQNVAWMSNKWLRAVVLGGNSHWDLPNACTLFRAIFLLHRSGRCDWNELAGSPFGTLRRWLVQRGGEEDAPWSWIRHGVRVSMRADAELEQQLYNLRVAWRDRCWTRFLSSDRHEVEDVGVVDG